MSPNLTGADGLMLLLYFFFVGAVGYSVKAFIKTSDDFLLAGRAIPAWVGGLALAGVGLGGEQIIAMGALGAHYGFEGAQLFGIGAIPAMLFAGLFMMPLYYGSKARSAPEYLRLRFDAKTRGVYACAFAAMAVFGSGIALYVVARIVEELHIFDEIFYVRGWSTHAILPIALVLPALLVLMIVLFGGLTGAMYGQVLQFFLIVAGILPAVVVGLRNAGGWNGLKKALPGYMHEWQGVAHGGAHSMGLGAVGLCLGLGVALGGAAWCVDFLVLQAAFAAKSREAARRVPLLAAIPMLFLPLLLVLPGLLAVSLPTPHTTNMVTIQHGEIIHNIHFASPAAAAGKGIVPAKANPVTGKPLRDASGQAILNYDMATPKLLAHFLPAGVLGLALAALLAGLMSGVAAGVTAFNSVFTRDIYQAWIRKDAEDGHYLAVARWATVGAVLAAIGVGFAAMYFGDALGALALAFSFVNAPLFATFLLGMFWKRTTGHGAFAGLLAGLAAAVAHFGLTLPVGAQPGLHGGWFAVLHRYPSDLAQSAWTAILAFAVNLIVTAVVSLFTKARADEELVGLVYALMPARKRAQKSWLKRPETLAAAILIAAVALNIFLA